MAQRREKKAPPGKERRPIKKKTSILITESIDYIDYKDVNLLRRFMSERAKVRARRVTGNTQQQQVAVAKAIRVAREMALLPYSVRQVTQRSKGRRDRGERGDRDRGDREGELRDIPGPIESTDSSGPDEAALDEVMTDELIGDDALSLDAAAEVAGDESDDE
jgi:small subunit ribosomal protein S18